MSLPTVTEERVCVSVRNWAREASKTGGFHQFTQRRYNLESRVEFCGMQKMRKMREVEFLLN
jgi:hypothetical protein